MKQGAGSGSKVQSEATSLILPFCLKYKWLNTSQVEQMTMAVFLRVQLSFFFILATIIRINEVSCFLNAVPLRRSSSATAAARTSNGYRKSKLHMNILSNIGDMLSGGTLVPQKDPLPYGDSLEQSPSSQEKRTLAIAERPISFTGEDFDVCDIGAGGKEFCRVRGAMMHLPGKYLRADLLNFRSLQFERSSRCLIR